MWRQTKLMHRIGFFLMLSASNVNPAMAEFYGKPLPEVHRVDKLHSFTLEKKNKTLILTVIEKTEVSPKLTIMSFDAKDDKEGLSGFPHGFLI